MNVTLIYSLLAYSSIRQRDFSGVYVSLSLDTVCLLFTLYVHSFSVVLCVFVCVSVY